MQRAEAMSRHATISLQRDQVLFQNSQIIGDPYTYRTYRKSEELSLVEEVKKKRKQLLILF